MERLPNQNSTFPWFVLPLTEKKSVSEKVFDLQIPGSSLNTVTNWWLFQEPLWNESVMKVPFLLTDIHLTSSTAGSLGGRHSSEVQGWRSRKISSSLITGCDCPASMIHILSSIHWTGAAQWPGPWPSGFSLRSRRLSDITAVYEDTAFGLGFHELLLLALLRDENFCLGKGSQRGFVVLPALPGILTWKSFKARGCFILQHFL